MTWETNWTRCRASISRFVCRHTERALLWTLNGNNMSDSKSSVSEAQSYTEMGEYWDNHSLADVWDRTEPAQFEVSDRSDATYYAVEAGSARAACATSPTGAASPPRHC